MGYLHIENLYRPQAQTILLFRECYALEKIHGTSAHITFIPAVTQTELGRLEFFSGGESHAKFVSLFNEPELFEKIRTLGIPVDKRITIYGEAYGGSQQGMSHTYGKQLKFIVFDVQVGDVWLSVPDAEDVAKKLGLEFVYYKQCRLTKPVKNLNLMTVTGDEHTDWLANEPERAFSVETNLSEIDAERDAPSMQAVRNGVSTLEEYSKGNGPKREGVVLRPLKEFTLNNGSRVIVKHKGDSFKETATPRPVVDPAKLQVLSEANAVANEWTTNTRLEHVLQKLPEPHDMSLIPKLIPAMIEDIYREGSGEFVESDAVKKAIGKKTVEIFKGYLQSLICQKNG